MNKKAISLFLALVMIIGLAIPGTLANEESLYDRLINTTAVISFYDYMQQATDEEKAAMTTQEITGAYNHLNKNFTISAEQTAVLDWRDWCNTTLLALPNAPALCSACGTLGGHAEGCTAAATPTPEITPDVEDTTTAPDDNETDTLEPEVEDIPEITPDTEVTPEPVPTTYEKLMAATDLETLYNDLVAIVSADKEQLYALTAEELSALTARTQELYAAIETPTDLNEESYSQLMEMWAIAAMCPNCGETDGQHTEDCPRYQQSVMPANGLNIAANTSISATTISAANTTWNFTADATVTLNGKIIIPSGKTLTINGNGHSAIIKANFTDAANTAAMFVVQDGGSLVLNGVTIDGGAVWGGTDNTIKRGNTNSGKQIGLIRVENQKKIESTTDLSVTNCNLINSDHFYPVFIGRSTRVTIEGGVVANCSANILSYTSGPEGVITLKGSSSDTEPRIFNMSGTELYGNKTNGGSGGIFRCNGTTMVAMTLSGINMHDNYSSGWGNILWNAQGTCTITGSTFTHNTSAKRGGAISSESAGVTVTNCSFVGNSAGEMGGAIAVFNYSLTTATEATELNLGFEVGNGCTFDGNSAPLGGAVAFGLQPTESTLPTTLSATIDIGSGYMKNNVATQSGGAIFAGTIEKDGNANILSGSQVELTVKSGEFTGNTAAVSGGAIFMNEIRAVHTGINKVIVEGGTIGAENAANSAPSGGAVAIDDGIFNMTDGTVAYNSASVDGGAIYVGGGEVNMTDGTISYNSASGNGGAICVGTGNIEITSGTISNNTAGGTGGALTVANGNVVIGLESCKGENDTHSHPVMENNTAGDNGGAIGIVGGITTMYCGSLHGNTCTNNPSSNSFYQNGGTFDIYGGSLDLGVDNDNGGEYHDHREGVYSVKFVSQYDGTTYAEITKEYNGGTITLPGSAELHATAYDRADMVLYGWSITEGVINEDYLVGNQMVLTDDATLYAIWVDEIYHIEYDYDGGNAVEKMPGSYLFSVAASSVEIPKAEKEGYDFLGWAISGDGNWSAGTCVTSLNTTGKHGKVKLTAQWGNVQYKIEYILNGGTEPGNRVGFNSGELQNGLVLKDPTKAGYTFTGWLDVNRDNNNLGTTVTLTEYRTDYKLEASWSQNTYTATLVYAGGTVESGTAVTEISFNIDEGFDLPSIKKAGYTFMGWKAAPAGDGENNWNPNTLYSGKVENPYGNVTLTAVWEENTVTITYAMSGPDGVSGYGFISDQTTETIGADTGTPVGSTATAAPGFKFVGWFKDSDSEPISRNAAFVPTKVNGLYESATYTAKFDYDLTSLTISVSGSSDANQVFLFKVSGLVQGSNYATTVAVHGSTPVKIDGLQISEEYTIRPLSVWSWRYGGVWKLNDETEPVSGPYKHTLQIPTGDNTLEFNVSRTNPYWLSGDNSAAWN